MTRLQKRPAVELRRPVPSGAALVPGERRLGACVEIVAESESLARVSPRRLFSLYGLPPSSAAFEGTIELLGPEARVAIFRHGEGGAMGYLLLGLVASGIALWSFAAGDWSALLFWLILAVAALFWSWRTTQVAFLAAAEALSVLEQGGAAARPGAL